MTRPPEYDQVARWLRVLSGDPGLLEEIQAGYPGAGDAWTAGQTRQEYAASEWQRLADEAHRELARVFPGGASLESAALDQVAEAYHRQQVAGYAHRKRALQEGIRQLRDGTFEVPSWCARRAERDGIDIAVVIEDYRLGALTDAHVELGELPRQYQVTEDEARAYGAATAAYPGPLERRAGAGSPGAQASYPGSRKEEAVPAAGKEPVPGLTRAQARRWAAAQPDDEFQAIGVGSTRGRAELVAGLRELADYLAANPAVPIPPYGVSVIVAAAGTDSQKLAQIGLASKATGQPRPAPEPGGYRRAERAFGPVTYRFSATSEDAVARHAALMSYRGLVEPDSPADQPASLAATAFPARPAITGLAPADPAAAAREPVTRRARRLT